MKKYSQLIKESTLPRWTFIEMLSNLMDGRNRFIVYKLGLFNSINKLLSENSTPFNGNLSSQYPLSLLYETGNYTDIEFNNGVYSSKKLNYINHVLDKNGNWDPVNKLNTNYKDLAELLYDLFIKLEIYNEIPTDNVSNLKSWLLDFKEKNDFYKLIKENLNFRNYTNNIVYLSNLGLISEEKVKNILIAKGCQILYQGGDGEPVDMVYGVDLIVKKDRVYTVQVKNKEDVAKSALNKGISEENSQYNKIDWFCSPTDSGVKIFTKKNIEGRNINL